MKYGRQARGKFVELQRTLKIYDIEEHLVFSFNISLLCFPSLLTFCTFAFLFVRNLYLTSKDAHEMFEEK